MAAIIVPPKWQIPERSITPQSIFCAAAGLPFGCGPNENAAKIGAQENLPLRICIRLGEILISF